MDFGPGEHHRQTLGCLGLLDIVQPGQLAPQHLPVEEQQGALGLVLRGCRRLPRHRQVGEKPFDFRRAQIARMFLAKMPNKSLNPIQICLFRAYAVVLEENLSANLVEKFGLRRRLFLFHFWMP